MTAGDGFLLTVARFVYGIKLSVAIQAKVL